LEPEYVDGIALELQSGVHGSLNDIRNDIQQQVDLLGLNDYITDILNIDIDPEDFSEEEILLGCAPEFSIYTFNEIEKDKNTTLRSCGGHIHIDYQGNKFELVEALDYTVGAVDLLWNNREKVRRQKNYGAFGAHREKKYGIEYRTPSNHWYWNDQLRQTMDDLLDIVIEVPSFIVDKAKKDGMSAKILSGNQVAIEKWIYGSIL